MDGLGFPQLLVFSPCNLYSIIIAVLVLVCFHTKQLNRFHFVSSFFYCLQYALSMLKVLWSSRIICSKIFNSLFVLIISSIRTQGITGNECESERESQSENEVGMIVEKAKMIRVHEDRIWWLSKYRLLSLKNSSTFHGRTFLFM